MMVPVPNQGVQCLAKARVKGNRVQIPSDPVTVIEELAAAAIAFCEKARQSDESRARKPAETSGAVLPKKAFCPKWPCVVIPVSTCAPAFFGKAGVFLFQPCACSLSAGADQVAMMITPIPTQPRKDVNMNKMLTLLIVTALLVSITGLALAQEPPKKTILVVSFGTSYNENRALTLDSVEETIAKRYPDWDVRRAYTAQTIIDILEQRDGLKIDNVTEAMDRLVADGVKELIVQPTLVMPGYEYEDVVNEVTPYAEKFEKFALGKPLIYYNEDYDAVVDALASYIPEITDEDTAVVLMGHGSHHFANATYAALDYVLHAKGYENVFVGAVEGFPTIEQVIANVTAYGAKKVVQYPFMIVAGDHANNDMAGDEEDSWTTLFTQAGFEVENRLVGLAQNESIVNIILTHLDATIQEAGL
jgi:sirohydrochlorin cobaltochelatase